MLPRDLNLNIGKMKGYNNKILVSNTDMKIGSNRDINKDHKKLPPPDGPKIGIPEVRHNNPKMLTENHNDEKLVITLLIVGTGLTTYHFRQKNKWRYYSQSWCRGKCISFIGTNFIFSRFTDHGEKERQRHDLAEEKLQMARDEWNRDRIKRLDFINKRLREKNQARAYINNVNETMLECYQVFAKQIKSLPPQPQLSNFCHPSQAQKNSKLLFAAVGTGIAIYALYKYLK